MEDLDALVADIWRSLARATRDRRAAFRHPTLATSAADGTPRARVVVMREVDVGRRSLLVHSDGRAGKVAELAAQPRLALVFWDPRQQVQLRVLGAGRRLEDEAAVAAAWDRLGPRGQALYAAAEPPGAPLPRPSAPAAPPAGDAAARRHFAALAIAVTALDWLLLARAGHRRARFTSPAPDRPWTAGWLAP